MDAADDAPRAPPLAVLSIASFWLFYFAIGFLRSEIVFHDLDGMVLERTAIALGGAALSALMYLVLRRVPMVRLRRAIAVAALLALPASCAFAGLDWYLFNYRHPEMARKHRIKIKLEDDDDEKKAAAAAAVAVAIDNRDRAPHGSPGRTVADQAFNAYFFFVAWATLYLALRYAAAIGTLERRTARLRSAAQAAELRALRYQVNPHFLFNTLNSLSSQVLSGRRDDAERMIANLSTFFRTSLTADPTRDVPLAEEIRLQRLYLDIEAVRFPQRLVVAIDVPDDLGDACVPGLLLQPLVENAVKYGVARSRRPVTIRIAAYLDGGALAIAVEDDGEAPPPAEAEGTGIGLANVADRLAARFGADASCTWGPRAEGGFAVRLALPLVRHGC